jgi:hypothetical protein
MVINKLYTANDVGKISFLVSTGKLPKRVDFHGDKQYQAMGTILAYAHQGKESVSIGMTSDFMQEHEILELQKTLIDLGYRVEFESVIDRALLTPAVLGFYPDVFWSHVECEEQCII